MPPPERLPAPNIESWPAEQPFFRVHHSRFAPTEFNPGFGAGRFHPLTDRNGRRIPTIYVSGSVAGAFSETIFHDVPVTGVEKRIRVSALLPLLLSAIAPRRRLSLIQLRGLGLRKLEIERRQLIDSDADTYPVTRKWAQALYERDAKADGLIWTSRQHDQSEALLLFGTRVRRSELRIVRSPQSLAPPGPGWDALLECAEAAGIRVDMP